MFSRAADLLGAAWPFRSIRPEGDLARLAPDTDSDVLLETMHRDGGLVIEGLLDRDTVARIDADLAPAVAARRPGFRDGFDDTFYGTNTVYVPLKDGTTFRGAWGGIAPLQNQYVESPGLWTLSSSLFKSFTIHEQVKMRVQWDVFNPTNSPQQQQSPANSQGLLYTYQNGTSARSMQFTLRVLW